MGLVKYTVICLCLSFATLGVFAQEADPLPSGKMRIKQPLSLEESKAAWKLEALGFSRKLMLSEEITTQVVHDYTDSRTRLQETIRNAFRRGTGDSPSRKRPGMSGNTALMLSQLMTRERVKLLENLRPILAGKQVEYAMMTLGSFSLDWDRIVHLIAGFEFSPEITLVTLSPIEDFIAGMSDAGLRNPSRADMQDQMQTLRNTLMQSMNDLLEDEQQKTFRQLVETIKIRSWENTARSPIQKSSPDESAPDANQSPLPRKLARYDANNDGKLSKKELPDFLHKMLDMLDKNKDGILTPKELKEMKEKFD